jgi:hypothetical protein
MSKKIFLLTLLFIPTFVINLFAGNYKNFVVSVYARAYEVKEMKDLKRLDSIWTEISSQLKVDKIYLETHRDKVIVDDETIEKAKKYFLSKGVKVAGGITYTIDESNHFETFCYTNPVQREKAKKIAELTAKHFDEFILDDFFFTSCKCDLCIKAKGNLSWTQFRLKLMSEAAQNLVIKPAKAVNSKVKVVIKYPNWYEHFQGLGFNLETGPKLFDGIYTGTETRDPIISGQHLQQYESYQIFRFFENIKHGGNGGGWVDPFGSFYLDRYAEQLWLTLFAKAPEITLFDFRSIQRPIIKTDRAQWQNGKTSFNYDEMINGFDAGNREKNIKPSISLAAGYVFNKIDNVLGLLGIPVGIKCYKPFHSEGEDFIHNFFGMIGLPIDLSPVFPKDQKMILLTESSKFDPGIVQKIKRQLMEGKNVTVTSGLLSALQGKGIEDIVELNYSDRKVLVDNFVVGMNRQYKSKEKILIPQIEYLTNDSWEDISCRASGNGFPILHTAKYGAGYLFVLAIPENFTDLYNFPAEVLNRVRQILSQDLFARIEGESQVSLFTYDNQIVIVESFSADDKFVKLITKKDSVKLIDMLTNEEISGVKDKSARIWGNSDDEVMKYSFTINPHSFRVLKVVSQ